MFEFVKDIETRRKISEYLEKNVISYDKRRMDRKGTLFLYDKLDDYTVKNLKSNQLSARDPSRFNDVYDSTTHINSLSQFQLEQEELSKEWAKLGLGETDETFWNSPINPEKFFREIDLHFMRYMTNDIRIKCFSEVCDSILMWSHYADSNRGICVEYDFSSCDHHNYIYPVSYLSVPLDLTGLFHDGAGDEEKELGVLLSVLTKNEIWSYEKEWRFILPFIRIGGSSLEEWVEIINVPDPVSITLGKNFIDEHVIGKKDRNLVVDLLGHICERNIPLKIIENEILSYRLTCVDADPADLLHKATGYYRG